MEERKSISKLYKLRTGEISEEVRWESLAILDNPRQQNNKKNKSQKQKIFSTSLLKILVPVKYLGLNNQQNRKKYNKSISLGTWENNRKDLLSPLKIIL